MLFHVTSLIPSSSEQDIEANVAGTSLDLEGDRKLSTIPSRASTGEPEERERKPTLNNCAFPITPYKGAKRKRGSTAMKLKREKTGVSQVRRQRARPARICEEKSEESSSCDEMKQDGSKMGEESCNIDERVDSKDIGEQGQLEDSESLQRGPDNNKVLDAEVIERKENKKSCLSEVLISNYVKGIMRRVRSLKN